MITEAGKIYYDSRENKDRVVLFEQIMERHKCTHELVRVNNFVTADWAYGSLAIECKRMYDFIGSVRSGSLRQQITKMKRAGFTEVHVVVTRELDELGDLIKLEDYGGTHVNSIVGALAAFSSKKYGCNTMMLDNEEQGMYYIYKLIEKHDHKEVTLDRDTIIPKVSTSDIKKAMLYQVEGLGKTKTQALLKAFNNSVEEISAASVEEIMKAVKGIGITIAERIKDALS